MPVPEKLARTRRSVLAFLAIAVPLIPASWYQASTSFFGRISDLPEYYAASWLILNGRGADIYVLQQIGAVENTLFPTMSGRVVPLFMAPPISVLIAPLALVPVDVCHYLWCALLVASIVGVVLVIGKLLRFTLEQRLVLWTCLCTFGPVFESIRIGQVAPFLLLAFSCALYFLVKEPLSRTAPAPPVVKPTTVAESAEPGPQRPAADAESAEPSSRRPAADAESAGSGPQRPAAHTESAGSGFPRNAGVTQQRRSASTIWAAFFLALLSCKPQILIPLLVALAGAGRYTVLFQTIGLIVALALVSLILTGPSGWLNYMSLLSNCFNDMSIMHADENPTVRGQLLRLLAGSGPLLQSQISIVSGIVYLLALSVIFWINRRFTENAPASSEFKGATDGSEKGVLGGEKGVLGSEDWLSVTVLTLPLGLVCSQYLMTYDLLLLVPALALFAGKKLYARFSPFIIVPGVCFGIIYMLPFYSWVHYVWFLKGGVLNPFFATLLYFAVLLSVAAFRLSGKCKSG